jgi:hypothetical protein
MAVAYSNLLCLSPMPDVQNVTGQPARNDEDGIDPDVVPISSKARCKAFGGNGYAAQAVLV